MIKSKFEKFQNPNFDGTDIVAAWHSVNMRDEVDIVQKNNGHFDLWIGCRQFGSYLNFDAAATMAECLVPVSGTI